MTRQVYSFVIGVGVGGAVSMLLVGVSVHLQNSAAGLSVIAILALLAISPLGILAFVSVCYALIGMGRDAVQGPEQTRGSGR